jgi:CheY-like chemotaxis protein
MVRDSKANLPVLVVDDHDETRNALVRLLDLQGYAVATAHDGQDALDYLQRRAVALIVMDLDMPRVDGWLLRRRLLDNPELAHIPVVVFSARAAGNLPDIAFVRKSDPSGLLDAIERGLPH